MGDRNEIELVRSVHSSIEHVIAMYQLLKQAPQLAQTATNINEYASHLQRLLQQFLTLIPKKCVPMQLFKRYQKENKELKSTLDTYSHQLQKQILEIECLEEKLKESYTRQAETHERSVSMQIKECRRKVISVRNGETRKNIDHRRQRASVPRLDRLVLPWMGPTLRDEILVEHLINKR